MSSIIDAEAEYKPIQDKIEAARSYDSNAKGKTRRPKPIPEWDAREDKEVADRSQANDGGFMDVLTDEEDGMLAMFKALRDLVFPVQEEQQEQDSTKDDGSRDAIDVEMPAWQRETIDVFLRTWHHIEVSDAARMLATDEEDSILAMCRKVGNSTFDELSAGSRVLSEVVLANMKLALETVQGMSTRAELMASDAVTPEGNTSVNAKAIGDFGMVAMLDPEEWS